MAREISAGGVVLRPIAGVWHVALIEPQKEHPKSVKAAGRRATAILALPKGLVDAGENPEDTAVREVHEETGIVAALVTKLDDIKYVYLRSWGDGAWVFKVVSFYLLRYVSGEIDDVIPAMRIEVKRALWVALDDAPHQLAYGNERKVLKLAEDYLETHGGTGASGASSEFA